MACSNALLVERSGQLIARHCQFSQSPGEIRPNHEESSKSSKIKCTTKALAIYSVALMDGFDDVKIGHPTSGSKFRGNSKKW